MSTLPGEPIKKMTPAPTDFLTVTEVSGDDVTDEQVERMCHRYYWAGRFCKGKAVLEVSCGTGQGLGYLALQSGMLYAGDYSAPILDIARRHYANRIPFVRLDAHALPYADRSFDIVVMFEALYYLSDAECFVRECRRVLKDSGRVLIATANKDLYDFNPSPFSIKYYGVMELKNLFDRQGFSVECYGYHSVDKAGWLQKILRPVKKTAVSFGLIPGSMAGKKLLKRLVFGKLKKMPAEIAAGMAPYEEPRPLSIDAADKQHKVIYCVATQEKNHESRHSS